MDVAVVDSEGKNILKVLINRGRVKMCRQQAVIEKGDSTIICDQPVLVAKLVDPICMVVIDELWGCPNRASLVDRESGRYLGIDFEDFLWALRFSKEKYHLI